MANPATGDTEVLGRIFGPTMGRILEKHLEVPVFFLTPHPKTWTLEYYAEAGAAREEISFPDLIRKHRDPALGSDANALDKLVENLGSFDPAALRAAAAIELCDTKLPLGWTDAKRAAELGLPSNWALSRGGSSTLRFMQHALDYAHSAKFDALAAPSGKRKLGPYGRSKKLIKISDYMKEKGLIDEGSFSSYLAESLYSQPLTTTEKNVPSRLDHFFLPLAGLGQWRAAACWVAYQQVWKRKKLDIDEGMQASIQALFSQALIDAFISQLDQALVVQTSSASRRDVLHDVFTLLWWSHEISFFRDGGCVALRRRNEEGRLVVANPKHANLAPSDGKGFLSICADPSCSTVQLDLTQLESERSLAREVFDCDRILFSVRLIDPAERDMVESVYGERLRERIGLSLRHYHLQQNATRAQTVEAIGHSMKNTVHITGWQESLRALQDLPAPRDPAVEAAIRSLSLYALVSGLGGLLRLVSLCERNEFDKIGSWSTPSALASWLNDPHKAFERYVTFIRNYVATICHGLGWRDGFELSIDGDSPSEVRYVGTLEPPQGSIRAWISEYGHLPPLSATEGPDAHTALMSALTEPISNAVRALLSMRRGPSARAGRLFVRIAANFPAGINVLIGNETDRPPSGTPPGLVLHRELLARSHLASLRQSSPPEWSASEMASYWIEVQLHPRELAERILARPTQGDFQ